MTRLLTLSPIIPAALALGAAQPVPTLGQAQPGLWEVSGGPTRGAVNQCVTDVIALAHFEHRDRACIAKILKSSGSQASVEYSCGDRDSGIATSTY